MEYDSDNFDMEPIFGSDNPDDLETGYDSSAHQGVSARPPAFSPGKNRKITRFVEVVDKKTGKRAYKAVVQDATQPRYIPSKRHLMEDDPLKDDILVEELPEDDIPAEMLFQEEDDLPEDDD